MMAEPWLLDGVIITSFLALVGAVATLIRMMRGDGAAAPSPEPDDSERAAIAKLLLADWERRFSDRCPSGPSDPLPLPELEAAVRRLSWMLMVRKSTLRAYYRDMGRFPETSGDIRSWSISDIRLKRTTKGRYDRD